MLPKREFFVKSVVRFCGARVTDVIRAEIVLAQLSTTRLALEAEVVFIGRYGVGGGSVG